MSVTAFQRLAVIHWSRARKVAWLEADDRARGVEITYGHWSDENLTEAILDTIDQNAGADR